MIDGWALWLLLVGLAVGAAGAGVLLVRLPREDDDIGSEERSTEAAWIASTIERHGGVAPPSLVEEVLELHGAYLNTPRSPAPPGVSAAPIPPSAPPQAAPPPPGHAAPPPLPSPPGSALPPQPGAAMRPGSSMPPGSAPPRPGSPPDNR